MRRFLLMISTFAVFNVPVFSQSDLWHAFQTASGDPEFDQNIEWLIGFRDEDGNVMIEPRFTAVTSAKKFDNIIPVCERVDGEYITYHLLKNGKRVGVDSVYINDMTFDAEREGFIRFTDHKTGRNGLFNRYGKEVIPARYALTPVANGLLAALVEPDKKYWHEGRDSGCDHWSWEGTQAVLMDTTGRIIVKDFELEAEIDLYSLEIRKIPATESWLSSFRSIDGKYYTFTDIEKYFTDYFIPHLIEDLSYDVLLGYLHPHIYVNSSERADLITVHGEQFLKDNYSRIRESLESIADTAGGYFILVDIRASFPDEWYRLYPEYFDYNGYHDFRYPAVRVNVNREQGQDHFTFIKTENGYKLITAHLR